MLSSSDNDRHHHGISGQLGRRARSTRDAAGGVLRTFGRQLGCPHSGFTLVELLVVMLIIVVLLSLLLPAIKGVRARYELVSCASRLRQIGQAHVQYGIDWRGLKPPIVQGRGMPDPVSPNIRWAGQPVGQGLLIKQYLKGSVDVLMCPSSEMDDDARTCKASWMAWENGQAPAPRLVGSSYAYSWCDGKKQTAEEITNGFLPRVKYSGLASAPIAMDMNVEEGTGYMATGELDDGDKRIGSGRAWEAHPRLGKTNVLYEDGHVASLPSSSPSGNKLQLKAPGGPKKEFEWFQGAAEAAR